MQKVLIADDDARMRQMLGQIVAALASAVYEARDGAEAILLYAAERPDWVLMDLRMKPMDGLRATQKIKAAYPEARIVIVSEYDDEELRARAARVGACAYVLKENLHELPGILRGPSELRSASCPSSPGGANTLRRILPLESATGTEFTIQTKKQPKQIAKKQR